MLLNILTLQTYTNRLKIESCCSSQCWWGNLVLNCFEQESFKAAAGQVAALSGCVCVE